MLASHSLEPTLSIYSISMSNSHKSKLGLVSLFFQLSKLWLCLEVIQEKPLEVIQGTGKQHIWETISMRTWMNLTWLLKRSEYNTRVDQTTWWWWTLSSSPEHFNTKQINRWHDKQSHIKRRLVIWFGKKGKDKTTQAEKVLKCHCVHIHLEHRTAPNTSKMLWSGGCLDSSGEVN